jgi:hypothetical protein
MRALLAAAALALLAGRNGYVPWPYCHLAADGCNLAEMPDDDDTPDVPDVYTPAASPRYVPNTHPSLHYYAPSYSDAPNAAETPMH